MATTDTAVKLVNGIDVNALEAVVREIEGDPARGQVEFRVRSEWKGQTRTRSSVESYTIGAQKVHRHFSIEADEPFELLGRNMAPNPQELLMSALNACIAVGYVAGASMKGIALSKLEIETRGTLDLRGFLGIDPAVRPGYDAIHYVVRIKGNGTADEFEALHESVARTSPNYFNISRPIHIDAQLVVE